MAVQYANGKIVTNGLVLALDAADKNSYPGSGTTWTDLSGNNNNGSLVNGPTFNSANGGSIVFDGSNDYISATLNCDKTNYSIDWWISPSTLANYNQNIAFNSMSTWGAFLIHTTSLGGVYVGTTAVDNTGRITPWRSGVYVTNTWQNFTWTFANGVGKFYKNSIIEASGTLLVSTDTSFTSMYIGGNGVNTINGRIANIKVYSNKVLSAAEVLQNYNAQKSRFGLT